MNRTNLVCACGNTMYSSHVIVGAHEKTRRHIHKYTHACIFECIHMLSCTHAGMHTCAHACMHTFAYVHSSCMRARIHIRHIHVHSCTSSNSVCTSLAGKHTQIVEEHVYVNNQAVAYMPSWSRILIYVQTTFLHDYVPDGCLLPGSSVVETFSLCFCTRACTRTHVIMHYVLM